MARGVVGDAGLIVLDEPTAAVDPLGEVELVRSLMAPELASVGQDAGKIVALRRRGGPPRRPPIVVSHRLGIARAADRIITGCTGRRTRPRSSHATCVRQSARDLSL